MTLFVLALFAAATPQAAGNVQSTAPVKEEKKICRAGKSTGSRLSQPERCMTAAEWRDEDSRNAADNDRARELSRPR